MQLTTWSDFEGKKVALLGAGSENLALLPYLLRAGATVSIHDRHEPKVRSTLPSQVAVVHGEDYLVGLDQYEILFRVAGLPVAVLDSALEGLSNRPLVTSPVDLFLAMSPCPTIGVTGSKGKGTTATMIGSILLAAGKKAVVVGNIGRPIFDCFKDLESDSYAVMELSSFQLEDLGHSPNMAVVLPISEGEHLQPLSVENPNYHQTVNDYVAAKAHIILHQQASNVVIYAADNDYSASIADTARSKKISVSQVAQAADFFVDRDGTVARSGRKLLELPRLGLQGQHIFLNATMAIAAASELGCRELDIAQGLISWRPLPHRLEKFADRDGVTFVDDSYATNPDATIAAIQSFDQPIIWIAGGSPKGASFDQLAEVVVNSTVRQAILIGLEAPRIRDALAQQSQLVKVSLPKTFAAAVNEAVKSAKAGEVVLLSPACASKDMFNSAADRGEQFKSLVNSTK